MIKYTTKIFIGLILFTVGEKSLFAGPKFEPPHKFPVTFQSRNTCYFSSINIALEAKYKTSLRLKKILSLIGFDGTTLATWEYKKKFADLTHIQAREYSHKKDLIDLLNGGEPVLVSTEIKLKEKKIRHVSVAYSYDKDGIWVSDPLDGKRKRLGWEKIFQKSGKVKYYNLRTIWVKSYEKWGNNSKERETKDDIWKEEKLLKN